MPDGAPAISAIPFVPEALIFCLVCPTTIASLEPVICISVAGIIGNEFPSLRKEFPVWPVRQTRWRFSNAWRRAAALLAQPRTSACHHPPWQSSLRDWSNALVYGSSIGRHGG